jgi:flagellar basal-body rod protein FlgF
MSNTMNILAATMSTDADALRVIAQNVSSADSVAYRRQVQISRPDFGGLTDAAAKLSAGELTAAIPLPQVQIAIDTRAGTLRNTAEPLDIAIQGDGYFVLNTARGELLTRRGDFHTDAAGILTAFSGDPVLGTEGVIHIDGTPQVDAAGTIRLGSQVLGHLRLVQLAADAKLVPSGDGLFASQGADPVESTTAQVHQGFLETSNVSPVNEMLRLLQSVRHFEAGQRFVRAYDEMLDRAITDLGKI